ncbi:MAG TPA: phosphoribosylamine--glycine ligase [Polyangia bacterium]|jgi:phosphoribosylamine--glycine ligase|nr:phosphoribosylamine--glycine ligase [Polyangia bacterium]
MMGSRILLVGSGGREHALAWKLATSRLVELIVVAPGNPGIATLPKVRCVPIGVEAVPELVAAAVAEKADLVVCGPETALVAGLGDAVRAAGMAFFGPSAAAAEIEGSKTYAKTLMAGAGVPTAAFGSFADLPAALRFIDAQAGGVVVKADGLAAGKGVVVASSKEEARAAARSMLADRAFGEAGARVVVEERLVGREVSMMALCDGERIALLATSEDHKAVGDGDVGPNTGGMGTYSPSPLVDAALELRILKTIFAPTVRALATDGRPFRGLLYGGLMLTPDRGPMVIEWNCRFGDPETQSVLVRMEDDLYPWLEGAARGALPPGAPRWHEGAAVCVVLASAGYPGKPRTGDVITGLPPVDDHPDVLPFHAGTRRDAEGRLVTAGGRVLGVTARGKTFDEARARAYATVAAIRFNGMHFRRDIGMRGVGAAREPSGR